MMLLVGVLLPLVLSIYNSNATAVVRFNRDIRPILSDKCYACHGPDGSARQSQLRLDSEAGAVADLGGGRRAIRPGDPDGSELVRRITHSDPSWRMPPVGSNHSLTATEIGLLTEWIRQGAKWEAHWSFILPVRPELPRVTAQGWVRNGIDHFVLARLEQSGLKPSPEADRATLLRRVTFDLTGLPPTIDELDQFINDRSPVAWEKVVDRLLASPRFGERMAFEWLDAARYADTNGYQIDGERFMWRWRDWVIEAFNQDMPFDRFTIEQLAGDMLPNPTLDQRIATGFNRNHRLNSEDGIVPEEYQTEYVVDRVDTTSTVFLGLTVGCARCHNHKFDPISQKEYYQLYAYFNSIPEDGRAFDWGNSAPWISAPTVAEQRQLALLERQIATIGAELKRLEPEIAGQQRRWEAGLKSGPASAGLPERGLLLYLPLEREAKPVQYRATEEWHNPQPPKLDEKTKKPQPPTEADEVKFVDGQPEYIPTPFGEGMRFDGKILYQAGRIADFRYKSTSRDFRERFAVAAWIRPDSENGGAIFTKMADAADERVNGLPRVGGVGLFHANGKLHFHMVREWNYDGYRSETETTLAAGEWHHVLLQFDGFRQYDDRVRLFVNGVEQRLKVTQTNLYLYWGLPNQPLRIGGGGGKEMRFRGMMDEVRLYTRNLDADEIAVISCRETVGAIAARPESARTPGEQTRIRAAFLAAKAPGRIRQLHHQRQDLLVERQQMVDRFATLMVMEELPVPRPAHLLRRGAYDAPGERVERGVPAILPPLSASLPNNRLGLARWLTSPEHPLTSRVAVNRFWQMIFGAGLVRTVEDFGSQGELPTHPELLDWLAVEFMEPSRPGVPPWSLGHLHRLITGSAAYRQSSRFNDTLRERDPNNRLLARGPRFRVEGEIVRDIALSVSGLLNPALGGRAVYPPAPEFLFQPPASYGPKTWIEEKGADRYRRSLYAFRFRSIPYPVLQAFDTPNGDASCVRRLRSNTPLQALTSLNEPQFVEAARALARKSVNEGGRTDEQRVSFAFRQVLGRSPRPEELKVLARLLQQQRARIAEGWLNASEIATGGTGPVGDLPSGVTPATLAAHAAVARALLNLDETITKE